MVSFFLLDLAFWFKLLLNQYIWFSKKKNIVSRLIERFFVVLFNLLANKFDSLLHLTLLLNVKVEKQLLSTTWVQIGQPKDQQKNQAPTSYNLP